MSEDFFDSLKQTITDTAEVVGKKTEDLVESQKLRSRIRNAKRDVQLNYMKMGEIVYQRFLDGDVLDEELAQVCEGIMGLQNQIAGYKEKLAGRRGQTICPACGSYNPREADFCMHCGAAVPKEEPKEDDIFTAGPVSEEETDEAQEVWDACTVDEEEESAEKAADAEKSAEAETEAADAEKSAEAKAEASAAEEDTDKTPEGKAE